MAEAGWYQKKHDERDARYLATDITLWRLWIFHHLQYIFKKIQKWMSFNIWYIFHICRKYCFMRFAIIAFCFHLHLTNHPSFFGIGVVPRTKCLQQPGFHILLSKKSGDLQVFSHRDIGMFQDVTTSTMERGISTLSGLTTLMSLTQWTQNIKYSLTTPLL